MAPDHETVEIEMVEQRRSSQAPKALEPTPMDQLKPPLQQPKAVELKLADAEPLQIPVEDQLALARFNIPPSNMDVLLSAFDAPPPSLNQEQALELWRGLVDEKVKDPIVAKFSERVHQLSSRNGDGLMDARELLVCFALLAAKESAEAMALAFSAVDTNDTGSVSREELFHLVVATLTVQVASTTSMYALPVAPIQQQICRRARDIVDELWTRAIEEKISFQAFSTHLEAFPPDWMNMLNAAYRHLTSVASDAKPKEAVLLEVHVKADGGNIIPIQLRLRDLSLLRLLRSGLRLREISPEEMISAFHIASEPTGDPAQTNECALTADRILKCIGALCYDTVESLGVGDLERSGAFLQRLFEAFQRTSALEGRVPLPEFATAVSVFCGGDRAVKLNAAFHWLDSDQDGSLSQPELFALLHAVLRLFVTLVERPEPAYVFEEGMAELAFDALESLFAAAQPTARDSHMTFAEFATALERVPDAAPWLAIFDVVELADPLLGYRGGDGEDEKEETEETEETEEIEETEEKKEEETDAAQLARRRLVLIRRIGFGKLTAEEVEQAFLKVAEEDANGERQIGAQAFSDVMEQLVDVKVLKEQEQCQLKGVMSTLFNAFDCDGTGTVSLNEFMSGMFLFTQGQSEDRLHRAFNVFDTDKNNSISADELKAYLRSFLSVTAALCVDLETASDEDFYPILRKEAATKAEGYSKAILERADTDRNGRLSWKEFSAACEHESGLQPFIKLLQ